MWILDGWRKVTVDDGIPVDIFRRPLLVSTRPLSLWPLLLCKAVLKVMAAFKVLDKCSPDEVPAVLWLTGWQRENLRTDPRGGRIYDRISATIKAPKTMPTVVLRERMVTERRQVQLLLLCQPMGVSKYPRLRRLIQKFPDVLGAVVSTTSRPPREHETDGTHYSFQTREQMEAAVTEGAYLECQEIDGHLYGTSVAAVRTIAASGRLSVLLVDVEGMVAMRQREEVSALFVYIQPSSAERHEATLRGRLREDESTIQRRLEDASEQYAAAAAAAAAKAAIKAGEEPVGGPPALDHVLQVDDADELFWQLKNACAELSPIIRNRLRGLPAYVLDYSDVIVSNSVEKPTLKPVLLVGPSTADMASLMARIAEEFPDVFGFPAETTTREEVADAGVAPSIKVSSEQFKSLVEAEAFLCWSEDTFVHPTLKKRSGVTKKDAADVIAAGRLCLIAGGVEAAKQAKRSGVDTMTIFVGPASIPILEERLRLSLQRSDEEIAAWMASYDANNALLGEDGMFDHVVTDADEDKTTEEISKLVSTYRPDVIAPVKDYGLAPLKPLIVCCPAGLDRAPLMELIRSKFKNIIATSKIVTTRTVTEAERAFYEMMPRAEFEAAQAAGKFLDSWGSETNGTEQYGASLEDMMFHTACGKLLLFECDIPRARRLKAAAPEAFILFLSPPDVYEYEARLRRLAAAAAAEAEERALMQPGDNVAAMPEKKRSTGNVEDEDEKLRNRARITCEDAAAAIAEGGLDMVIPDTASLVDVYMELHDTLRAWNPAVVFPPPAPLVISGPDGSAKPELLQLLLQELPGQFRFCVSSTTRPPAPGEVNGQDFWFLSREAFQAGLDSNKFVEWTAVELEGPPPTHRDVQLYGTTYAALRAASRGGCSAVLEADVKSAAAMAARNLDAVFVYVEPPSDRQLFGARLEASGETTDRVDEYFQEAQEQTAAARSSGIFSLMISGEEPLTAAICRLKEAVARRNPQIVQQSTVWGFGRPLWDPSVRTPGEAPLRIMLLGPAASGKSSQADRLCAEYGLPYINVGQLLRSAVYDTPTPVGRRAQEYLNRSRPLPDELMLELLRERITAPDCRQRGWLLDGFPHTAKQADSLAGYGIVPDKVVFFSGKHSSMMARALTRRLDPETGKVYNPESGLPAPDEETARRLQRRHDDLEDNVRKRLLAYEAQEAQLRALFAEVSVYVDAELGVEAIANSLRAFVTAEAESLISLTPVTELRMLEYRVVGAAKQRRRNLLALRDLVSPVRGPDLWVDLVELCRHLRAALVYCDPTLLAHECKLERLGMGGPPPEVPLLLVDSPEPVHILCSLSVGPSAPVPPPAAAAGSAPASASVSGAGTPSAAPRRLSVAQQGGLASIGSALSLSAAAVTPPPPPPNVRECHALIDEYDWRSVLPGHVWAHLATSTAESNIITIPRGRHLLRLNVDAEFCYAMSLRSSTPFRVERATALLAEVDECAVAEVQGVAQAAEAGDWAVLLRQSFAVPAAAAAGLLVMLTMAVGEPACAPSMRLCVVDNDSSEVTTHLAGKLPATTFKANQFGYTLVVYQHSVTPLPISSYKLAAFSSHPLSDWATVASPKPAELSEEYSPNMRAVLCSLVLTAAERCQLALRFETDVPSGFRMRVTPYKAAAGAETGAEAPAVAEQAWTATTFLTLPAVTLLASQYLLEARPLHSARGP